VESRGARRSGAPGAAGPPRSGRTPASEKSAATISATGIGHQPRHRPRHHAFEEEVAALEDDDQDQPGAISTTTRRPAQRAPADLETALANQGTISYDADGVSGGNEATRLTDDPTTPDAEDPAVFLVAAASILEIPTLDGWALGLLALLLATGGVLAARRG
jgi:hypothetical protein